MTVISGQRTTANIASSQRAIDLSNPILLLEPDSAPLVVITKNIESQGRREAAQDSTYYWHEDALETRFDAINHGGGYTTETSIVVDTGTLFRGGENVLVTVPRTGEVMLVTGVATNTLTVTRAYAGTSSAGGLNDDEPLFIGMIAAEEGSTSVTARTNNPVQKTNYTQIFKTSVEESGTNLSSANLSSPHDWPWQHKKKAIEHMKDIEHAALFGHPSTNTGPGGKPLRTTGGVLHFYTSNLTDAGGTLSEAEIETWLRGMFRYGGQKKTVFASPLVVSVINNFSQGRLQTRPKETTYGVAISEWVSAHGTVGIVKHNLLEGAVWGGYAIGVDFGAADVKYRYLNGSGSPGGARDTKLLTNRQANDSDGQKDEWLTECGFTFPLPQTGGVLSGVTG